jgi:hypothetical protein
MEQDNGKDLGKDQTPATESNQTPTVDGKPLKDIRDVIREEAIKQESLVSDTEEITGGGLNGIDDYISPYSPYRLKPEDTDQKQNKEFLDKEKASYLFDADEISTINNDLNKIQDDSVENMNHYEEIYGKDYVKFLKDNQDKLESAFKDGYDRDRFIQSSISFEKAEDKIVRVKVVEDPDNRTKEKITKEILDISTELSNQKGLAKIWAIDEKFGIDPDKDITEEVAFNKELNAAPDEYYKVFRLFKEDYQYTIPETCPLCKGEKHFKLLFFKIKCPRCAGKGDIQVSPEKYYKKVRKNVKKGTPKESYTRTLVFEDTRKTIKF